MGLFSQHGPARPLPTLEAIFHQELGFILGALLHFGVPPGDAEDAAQEVLRAVMRSLPSFDPSRELRPWLYGIAFHEAGNRLRRARRHRARFADDAGDVEIADTALNQEERMIHDDTHRAVREVLDDLDLDRRAVLIARIVHGMSELETAEALSIPIGTVKSRLRLAKKELYDGLARRDRQETRGALLLPLGALLAGEQRISPVSTAIRARLWEQVQGMPTREGGPAAPTNGGGSGPANDGGRSPLRRLLRRLVHPDVGRILVGAAGGGALVFALGPFDDPPVRPAPPTREELAALCAARTIEATPSASAAETATAAPSSPAAPVPSAPVAAPSAAIEGPEASALDPAAEADMMHSATMAFERNDTATALKLLEQHAREFRRGKLGTSRELLWVRVLLREGKRTEAKAKADALRKAAPHSPMIPTLDALFGAEASP